MPTAGTVLRTSASDLVAEVRKVVDELQRLESDWPAPQLYLDLSLRYANTSVARLEELASAIASSEHPGQIPALIRRMKRELISTGSYRWPARDATRLFPAQRGLYEQDLTRFRTHFLELQALVVHQLTRENPERFGTIVDLQQHEERIAALKARLRELAERVQAERTRLQGEVERLQTLRGELAAAGV